jgi:hypothetical protein
MLKAITAWLVIFLGMGVGGVLGGRATSTFSQPDPHPPDSEMGPPRQGEP